MDISPLQRVSFAIAATAAVAALAFCPPPLRAAPLDKPECEKLKAEMQSLVRVGVEKEVAKGPEWAKANLKAPDLELVKRYLAVEEQLKFRCRAPLEPPKAQTAAAAQKGPAKAVAGSKADKEKTAGTAQKAQAKPDTATAKPGAAADNQADEAED